MLFARLTFWIALGCAAGQAQAASFDCVAPVFPAFSSSNESARRVERQVRAWRKCHAEYRAGQDRIEVARMNAEVEAGLEKWLAATRGYWTRQGASVQAMSRLERESAVPPTYFVPGEARPIAR